MWMSKMHANHMYWFPEEDAWCKMQMWMSQMHANHMYWFPEEDAWCMMQDANVNQQDAC